MKVPVSMETRMQVEIEVQSTSASGSIPADDQFHCWVKAALDGRHGDYSLAIRVVDEAEMQKFNHRYRQKNYPTNVLSFPSDLPEHLPPEVRESLLGDLLICAPVVEREALEQKRSQGDHWAHLTIHGVLHLLGYDHELDEEAVVMESMEKEILAKLGISDPYIDIS